MVGWTVGTLLLGGCAVNGPGSDVVLPKMEDKTFVTQMDGLVLEEKQGARPPEGIGSWHEYWATSFKQWKSRGTQGQQQIDYVVAKRKKSELPDITMS